MGRAGCIDTIRQDGAIDPGDLVGLARSAAEGGLACFCLKTGVGRPAALLSRGSIRIASASRSCSGPLSMAKAWPRLVKADAAPARERDHSHGDPSHVFHLRARHSLLDESAHLGG
jgi:hypothetical protein